jgi:multidrug efflux system membrane fusion protein
MISLLALGAGACGKKGAMPPRPPAMVRLAPAVKMPASVVITAYGTTQDKESVDVVPQVSGVLQTVLVQDGAVVTNGQPLFLIDPRDYQMRLQQAEGMIAVDRSNLELARATLQRNQPLLEKRLISTDNFDVLKTRVASLESQLKMDEAAVDQARLNLSRCTLTAPLAGICSKRTLDAGNLATAGLTRLINIRSYDPLRLDCTVSEQYLPAIRRAMAAGPIPVDVTPQGDTNRFTGTLSFMDNAVNPATGTLLLRGEVPNPDLKLWANQFVTLRIIVDTLPDAIMVPESAVQFGKAGSYLYVTAASNTVAQRAVTTGIRDQDLVQITSGVAEGEVVVTLGQLTLYPGATVMDAGKAQK